MSDPADRLTAAADRLRETAERAICRDRWCETCGGPDAWLTPVFAANAIRRGAPDVEPDDHHLRAQWDGMGEHVALNSPTVAMAVADWLDEAAMRREVGSDYSDAALAVAYRVLGSGE